MDDNLSLTIRRCKRSKSTKLDLNGMGLSILPQEIYQLTDLETLIISNNKLLSLDAKISNMLNLEFLDISGNQLVSLPSSLASLKKLHVLNVSGNPLGQQFERLLSKENQSEPNLHQCLRECLNVSSIQDSGFLQSNQSPEFRPSSTFGGSKVNWLSEDKSPELKATFSSDKEDAGMKRQLSETESLLAREQQKTLELKKELDKLKALLQEQNKFGFQNKGPRNEFGLQDEVAQLLELDYNELDVQDAVSQGGFSIVHNGYYRGTRVAIKKIFNPNITSELMAELSNEVDMLNRLRHPNIVLLMGISSKPSNLCIVTEFLANGSLFEILHMSKAQLELNTKLDIARELALAINFLHLSKIVHRDIKSHNVLLDEKFRVKLGDFGLARSMDALNKGASQFSGTPTYMAPEIFQKRAYDEKIDVFAYGTLLWELFTRKVPFEGLEPTDIMQKVIRDDQLSMTGVPKKIAQLVADCRMVDPKKRPSFDKILGALNSIASL